GWLARLLPSWLPSDYLFRGNTIAPDGRVYLFTVLVSASSAVVFGLVQLAFARRHDLTSVLGQGGRLVTPSRRQRAARHALVVAEVTVALVLLFGAGLFLNSFVRLTRVPLGFDPSDRLTLRLSLNGERYVEAVEVRRFTQQLIEETRALPGVARAAAGSTVPLASGQAAYVSPADQPLPKPGDETRTIIRAVSPAYFET